nr:hypothetical protein [Tanacetum cinerariifolium]
VIQRQSWNKDSRLDDLRRDEVNGALSDVCEGVWDRCSSDSFTPTESTQGTHRTPSASRLEPRSNKESTEVGITDVIVPVNVYDEEEEEDEITDEVYELKRMKKGKKVEEYRITPFPTPIRSPRIHTDLELHGRYRYLFKHLRAKFMPRKSFVTLDDHLHEAIADSLPTMLDKHIKEQVEKQVPEQVCNQVLVYVAEGLILERQKTKEEMEKMIAKAILQEQIITRRANDCIVSITKPDFKSLNRNDIEDMYLLIMKGKSHNNDVRYGYNQRDLTKDEVEYLNLFEEDIEDRLEYRRKMRR